MKENFPDLEKEIDMQVQEAQKSPKQDGCKEAHPKPIIIKMPKFKGKERILKAAREKKLVTYRGVPIRLSADFSKRTFRRNWQEIFSYEKQGPTVKITLLSKAVI